MMTSPASYVIKTWNMNLMRHSTHDKKKNEKKGDLSWIESKKKEGKKKIIRIKSCPAKK